MSNEEVLNKVIKDAIRLQEEFRSNKRTNSEVRTECTLLNTINNSVSLKIKDYLLKEELLKLTQESEKI